MTDKLPPSRFGAGYTVGGEPPRPPVPSPPPFSPPSYVAPPPHQPAAPPHIGQWGGSPQPAQYAPPPPPYATSAGGVIGTLRSNKLVLHALAGTLGGAAGALLAEVVSFDLMSSEATIVVFTGLWASIFGSVIATALFLSDAWHQRRGIQAGRVGVALLFGAVAGFIAGAVAQAVFLLDIGSFDFKNYVLRTFCWGLAGLLIGGLLSRTVPNLGLVRGSAAGFIGGCTGGICFVLISNELPEVLGRVCGIAALGLALGLSMYMVESLFREASLEVIWAPNETSRVSLGSQPITIGGNVEDDVYVPGLPANLSTVVLYNGQIEHIENYEGKRTPLRNGSQLQVGPINLVVHARP